MVKVLLVGDSDIAFWPRELLPSIEGMDAANDTILFGHSGATLADVVTTFRQEMVGITTSIGSKKGGEAKLVVVACAGENDIANDISLDSSLESLEAFFDQIFSMEAGTASCEGNMRIFSVIFLGPKFEPWLESDSSSKKKYSKMSRAFARLCDRHANSDRIHYVDCLTMFCGDSAHVPGAVLAGRACAEANYFASDRLHLNHQGYRIWKDTIESLVRIFVT